MTKDKAIEYLQNKGYKTGYKEPYQITEKALLNFMLGFAQSEVNKLNISDVSKSPRDKLYEWCDNEGTEIGAELIICSDNIEPIIVNCCSRSSLSEFKDSIKGLND